MFSRVAICSLCCLILATTSPAAEPLRNRREFITALNKVQEEMPEADVLKLLGKPDDIRTQEDHHGTDFGEVEWRYGTSGHLTIATLGSVTLDRNHKVLEPWGICGQGKVIPDGLFEESQLRILLDALGQVERSWGDNPRPLIRAVNLLQPLEKEKALEVIEEYIRRRSHANTIGVGDAANFVMRLLFEVPADPGYFPDLMLWISPEEVAEKKRFPRFPIILIGDVPLCVGHRAGLGGGAPSPAELVPYFRKQGVMRAKPLMPTDKPFAALDEYANSPRWYNDPRETRVNVVLGGLRRQIFALLETVYQVEQDRWGQKPPFFNDLKDGKTRLAEASKLEIRWDPKTNQYAFLDGKSLPVLDPNRYRRLIWKIPESAEDSELIFERETRHSLSIITENSGAKIQIFNIKAKDKTLCEPFELTNVGSGWTGIRFDEGEQLQAEVTVNNKKYLSPVFKP